MLGELSLSETSLIMAPLDRAAIGGEAGINPGPEVTSVNASSDVTAVP